jgi:hypothetical protein
MSSGGPAFCRILADRVKTTCRNGNKHSHLFEQLGGSIAWPFLAVLVFWVSVLFLGFGLAARFNATVTVALLVGALSVAGAIFLILELSEPYHGLMRISDEPLRNAMAQIDH